MLSENSVHSRNSGSSRCKNGKLGRVKYAGVCVRLPITGTAEMTRALKMNWDIYQVYIEEEKKAK